MEPPDGRARAPRRWQARARALFGATLQALGGEARALLFPQGCLACDAPAAAAWPSGLCASCSAALPWRPSGSAPAEAPLEVGRRRFAAVVVALRYQPPVDELILRLKYGGLAVAARPLAQVLAAAVERAEQQSQQYQQAQQAAAAGAGERSLFERPDLLVPIPMHPWKRLVRGGDHADELVEELAACLGRPVERLLQRRRATVAQGGARSLRERIEQVHRAFAVRAGRAARAHGRHVGLVDDVVTSGATAAAAAFALRRAGAAAVSLLAVAGNG